MQIYPKDSYGVMNMARAYVSLNRFDEAQSILDQATAQHLDSRGVHTANFRLALLRGDENTIKKDLEQVAGHYEEPELYLMRAEDLCLRGKIRETRQSYTRALDSARTQNMKEYRANIFESEAGCEVDVGFLSQARLEVNAALAESQDRNAKTGAAYVLARLGDEAKTNEILDDLDKASPADTLIHGIDIPRASHESQPQSTATSPSRRGTGCCLRTFALRCARHGSSCRSFSASS